MGYILSQERREQRLAAALRAIEARLGPGVVRRLREHRPALGMLAVPSGSLGLDLATGFGGFPRGHVTELIGPESSGRTALLYAAFAAVQRQGGLAALVDAEGGVDAAGLTACGVNTGDLLVIRPASAPDALLFLTILARCGAFDALGLSSVAALRDLPAGRVRGGDDGELRAVDVARLLARGLRVLTSALLDGPTAVIFTNDLLPTYPGIPSYSSPGGLALRHHAALRVAIEPVALLPDGIGGFRALRTHLQIVKHKLGVPGGKATVEVIAEGGIDEAAELLDLGLTSGLVVRGPLGFSWGEAPLGQSEGRARRILSADLTLAAALRAAIAEAHARPAA